MFSFTMINRRQLTGVLKVGERDLNFMADVRYFVSNHTFNQTVPNLKGTFDHQLLRLLHFVYLPVRMYFVTVLLLLCHRGMIETYKLLPMFGNLATPLIKKDCDDLTELHRGGEDSSFFE